SGTVSAEPQKKFEAPRQDLREASNLYNKLMARLSPMLYKGIEDVLQRWKKTLKSGGDLNLVVVAPINGFYRVVGATFPADAPMRQNNSKLGEGLRGFFTERRVAGYARAAVWVQPTEDKRPVFDRTGQVIGEVPSYSPMLSPPSDTKWRYYRPIFEKSAANPWSDRVVGLINVHSTADDGERLFKTAEFQQQVDSITTEVSPYLDVIQVLVGEEKL
ncbi:MAG: hypothetical protein VST67_11390, partial [Nitrospirota bacterium]|nr:hypothetical protein [Nitrospirota bacterium]